MQVILAILNFVASQIGTILGITQQLQSNTAHGAQEATPYRIDIQVQNIANTTTDLTWGLPALHAQLTAISTALATRQSGSSAVILPSTPPTGYGANNSAIATAIWTYVLPSGADTGDALNDVYGSAEALGGQTFVSLPGFPWIVGYSLDNWQNLNDQNTYPPAILDASTILSTDASILAWANRAHHGPLGWTNTSFRGTTVPMQLDQNTSNVKWIINMTHAQFLTFQAAPAAILVPPVWPGLAKVTLGTAVAMSDGLTVTGPLHGVIVHITAVAYPAPFYPFGALKSFSRIGGIVFVDDNGQADYSQPIALENGVICPRTMTRASSAILRLQSGGIGTITPWSIP
jgi:hypothetical protein